MQQPACAGVWLEKGETIISVSSGGGGYGKPCDRSQEAVLRDIDEGYISQAAAASTFGIILTASGALDAVATKAARARLSEAASLSGAP